jgi:hypothetical protein
MDMNGLIIIGLRNTSVLSSCEVIVLRRNMQDRERQLENLGEFRDGKIN